MLEVNVGGISILGTVLRLKRGAWEQSYDKGFLSLFWGLVLPWLGLTRARVTPFCSLWFDRMPGFFYFTIWMPDGMVSYTAPKQIAESVLVRERYSHSCEYDSMI